MSMPSLKLGLVGMASLMALSGAAEAKTLIFCSEGSPEGFNPQLYTSGTTFDASSRQVFNRLFQAPAGSTEAKPALATGYSVSDDGKVYTLKLREGVKWQKTKWFTPTRDFNADDVIFSIERQSDPNNPWHKVGGGNYEYFEGSGLANVLDKVEKVDEHTVKVTLKQPDATFIEVMGMDFMSILSAEYADKMMQAGTPDQLDLQPVGTGPFTFVNYQKDAVIRYKANPDYWEGKAPLDNLVFAITPDAAVRWQKLRVGECQVMAYPAPADLPTMRTDPSTNLLHQNGLTIGYIGMNVEKKPLDDARVRQALNMAINKDAIVKAVYQGSGEPEKNPMPPTIWGYDKAIQPYPYDPEGAKKLLAAAGHADGFKTTLWAMPVARPYNPNARRMAVLVQSDWKKIGVDAQVVSYEWGEYLKRTQRGEQDSFMLGWTADIADPDNFLGVLLGCDAVGATNRARWCDHKYSDLINQAKRVTDKGERTKLYQQAQVIAHEQAPWIPMAHTIVYQPVRKEVKNFKIDYFGGNIFYGVDLEG